MRQRGGAERAKTVRMFFWKRGVLAAAMAALILSGCSEYESSEELRAQAGTEAQADGEVQAAAEVRTSKQTETGADISGRSQSRTRAALCGSAAPVIRRTPLISWQMFPMAHPFPERVKMQTGQGYSGRGRQDTFLLRIFLRQQNRKKLRFLPAAALRAAP